MLGYVFSLSAEGWHWAWSVISAPTPDQWVGLAAVGSILGGLVHVVFRTGRVLEKLDNLDARTCRIERLMDGQEAPELPPHPPRRIHR